MVRSAGSDGESPAKKPGSVSWNQPATNSILGSSVAGVLPPVENVPAALSCQCSGKPRKLSNPVKRESAWVNNRANRRMLPPPEFEEPDRPVCTDVAGGEGVQFGGIAEADLRRPRKVNRLARALL